MEPAETPIDMIEIANSDAVPTQHHLVYVAVLTVWEVDEDSFCVGGRRFYTPHHLNVHDRVRVTIEKLPKP